jgi:competence protein ComEC
MKYPWAAFPFLRYTSCFAMGILLQKYLEWSLWPVMFAFALSAAAYLGLLIYTKDKRPEFFQILLGGFGLILLLQAGAVVSYLHHDLNYSSHFSHHPTHNRMVYRLHIADDPVIKGKFIRVKADVEAIKRGKNWQKVIGKCQIYFLNAPSAVNVGYGTILLAKGAMQPVPGPLNPDDFDYAKYLSYQNVFQQIYLREGAFKIIGEQPENWLKHWAFRFRNHAEKIIVRYLAEPREYAITSALVLGIKDHLDNPLRTAYSEAGATHLLAVSGLHVGLIYGLFVLVFSIYKRDRKHFTKGYAGLVLFMLWFYAFVTGLSPSVLRAVTMFSIMVVANTLNRKGNIFNTLALSAFVLLCFNPNLLFEVGFQLSYAAVAGILFMQPRLSRLIYFDAKLLNWVWEVLTVTLAAQIATAPFSLLYFNQFPVYFLVTNLFAIPLATAALYSGVALATLGSIHWLGLIIGKLNFWLVWAMNELILLEQSLPYAAIKQIPMSTPEVVLLYAFLVLLLTFLFFKRLQWLKYSVAILLLFVGVRSLYFYKATKQKKWIVYHIPGHRAIGVIEGRKAVFLLSDELYQNKMKQHYHFSRHWTNLRLSQILVLPLELQPGDAEHIMLSLHGFNTTLCLINNKHPATVDATYTIADMAHVKAALKVTNCRKVIVEGNKRLPKWLKTNTVIGEDKLWVMRERGAYVAEF